MKTKPLRIVSEDEFWTIQRKFEEAHRVREATLSIEQQAEKYDRFYDSLVEHLRAIGSQCDDIGEGDFITSRYVDPNDVTVVVSETETVFYSGALDAAFAAITEVDVQHMVIFDTGSYLAVLPDGTVIGYSKSEDLIAYDQER